MKKSKINKTTISFLGVMTTIVLMSSSEMFASILVNDKQLNSSYRRNTDLSVSRMVKDCWVWTNWTTPDADKAAPEDFLQAANSPGAMPLYYQGDDASGNWFGANQYWPDGKLKYDQGYGPSGSMSTNLNFAFTAYDMTGTNVLYRFGATATRTSATSEELVNWDKDDKNQFVRIATTDMVENGLENKRDINDLNVYSESREAMWISPEFTSIKQLAEYTWQFKDNDYPGNPPFYLWYSESQSRFMAGYMLYEENAAEKSEIMSRDATVVEFPNLENLRLTKIWGKKPIISKIATTNDINNAIGQAESNATNYTDSATNAIVIALDHQTSLWSDSNPKSAGCTNRLDSFGNLYKGEVVLGGVYHFDGQDYFYKENQVVPSGYTYFYTNVNTQTAYYYSRDGMLMCNGKIAFAAIGLDPLVGDDISPVSGDDAWRFTFTPQSAPVFSPTPYDRFARKSEITQETDTNVVAAIANEAVRTNEVVVAMTNRLEQHVGDTTNNPHQVTAEQVNTYDKSEIDALVSEPKDRIVNQDGAEIRADMTAVVVEYLNSWNPSSVKMGTEPESDYFSDVAFVDSMGDFGEWYCSKRHYDGQHWVSIGVRMQGDYWDKYAIDLRFPNGVSTHRMGVRPSPQIRKKIALTSDIPPPPGNYAAVSNAAMTAHVDATNYTDMATNEIVKATKTSLENKQDVLPYPTNAIPSDVIANPPWMNTIGGLVNSGSNSIGGRIELRHGVTNAYWCNVGLNEVKGHDLDEKDFNIKWHDIHDHVNDKSNNPHNVTAEQINALSVTGGVVNGDLKIEGSWKTKETESYDPNYKYYWEIKPEYDTTDNTTYLNFITHEIKTQSGNDNIYGNFRFPYYLSGTPVTEDQMFDNIGYRNEWPSWDDETYITDVYIRDGYINLCSTKQQGINVYIQQPNSGWGYCSDCVLRIETDGDTQINQFIPTGDITRFDIEWMCDPLTDSGSIKSSDVTYVYITITDCEPADYDEEIGVYNTYVKLLINSQTVKSTTSSNP